jgi:hypothetical protein
VRFAQLRDSSQLNSGQALRFLLQGSPADVLLGQELDVRFEFQDKVPIQIIGLKNGANPGKRPMKGTEHGYLVSFNRNKRPIVSDTRCQFSVSSISCFWPALEIE